MSNATPNVPVSPGSRNHSETPGPATRTVGAKEAARLLNISERLLWTYTNAGEVPHIRIGRRVLYGLTQLDAWLADRTKGGSRA